MERITNPTYEMWKIYSSRKNYLLELKDNFEAMDLLTEQGRNQIVDALKYEISHIQKKINDLCW